MTSIGGKISSIISTIFKLLSCHAIQFEPICLDDISFHLVAPSVQSQKGFRPACEVRAQQTEICQKAERPPKVQPLLSQSIQTEDICPLKKRGNLGDVENDGQEWEEYKMVVRKWKI